MHVSTTLPNHRDLFVARRNPLAARWTTRCGLIPHTAASRVPGDGISDREKDAGHWGSTADDGSVPDPEDTRPDDERARSRRPSPPTPGTDVDADNENLAEDTPLVGDREGSQVMRGPRRETPTDAP